MTVNLGNNLYGFYSTYHICTYTNLNMKGYVKKKIHNMCVQYGHICMHGIKRLFVEGLPLCQWPLDSPFPDPLE